MGLMDKFKNLFTDEEIIDDEEEEIENESVKIKEIKNEKKKDENKLPTFMREKIAKEEGKKEKENDFVSDFSISRELKLNVSSDNSSTNASDLNLNNNNVKNSSFKFPIEFEENDFPSRSRASRHTNDNLKASVQGNGTVNASKALSNVKKELKPKKEKKVSELYKDKKEKPVSKSFKATPIISPVYGVLDKNYRSDELQPNDGGNYEINRPSKSIDFDSVRKKAYGSVSVEEDEELKDNSMCKDCEYLKKAKACKKKHKDDDLMYEAMCEKDDVEEKNDYEDITLDEATENYYDYGVEYQKKPSNDVEISNYDDGEEEIINKKSNKEIPPVKSSINLLSTLKKSMGDEEESENKDTELTDDLYNLIDSMYDEGDE